MSLDVLISFFITLQQKGQSIWIGLFTTACMFWGSSHITTPFIRGQQVLFHQGSAQPMEDSIVISVSVEFENQNQKQIQLTIWWWDEQACLANGQRAFIIRCDFSLLFIFFKYRRRQNYFNIWMLLGWRTMTSCLTVLRLGGSRWQSF